MSMATDQHQIESTNATTRWNAGLTAVLSWIATLAVPVALIGLSVRLVLLPVFVQIEYRVPGLPPDDYGFNMQQRIHWATYSWNYLVNSSDISYLGDLRFDDGSPLFNERELSHMQDVKRVIGGTFRAWDISLVALLLI